MSVASEEHKRSGGALDDVRRHMRILVDIGRLAGESSDLSRFLNQVVMQVARAVEIDHVKVLQYRPRTADLLVVAGIGWGEGVVGIAALSADLRSAPGRAFQTAEPVTIRNVNEQEEYIPSDLLKQHQIVSLANVPVLIEGAAWGVLEVDSTTSRADLMILLERKWAMDRSRRRHWLRRRRTAY
jgi:transcriptional regulator with GAF, ATPase, and Fis domain